MWTSKTTDELLRTLIATDPHPAEFLRAVPRSSISNVLRGLDIGPGSAMWLPPEKRVDAW